MFNIYSASSFIAGSICVGLSIFIYLSNKTRLENISFAIITFFAGIWTYFPFATTVITDNSSQIIISRIIYIMAIFTPSAFLYFCLVIIDQHNKKTEKIIFFLTIILAFLFLSFNFSNLIIQDIYVSHSMRAVVPGILYFPFVLFFSLVCGYGFIRVWISYIKSTGVKRNKLKYMFTGWMCGYIAGLIHFQTAYTHFEPFPHDILLLIYVLIIAYAISKYRIMDIHFLAREITIYLSFFVMYIIPFLFIYYIAGSSLVSIVYLLLGSLSIPFSYPFFKKYLQPIYDEKILGGKLDYLKEFPHLSSRWALIKHSDDLLKRLVLDILDTMNLTSANVMIYDDFDKVYYIKSSINLNNSNTSENTTLIQNSPLIVYLKEHNKATLKEELEHILAMQDYTPIVSDMNSLDAALSLPITIDNELKGIVNLGHKKTNDMFNQNDIDALNKAVEDVSILLRYSESIDLQSDSVYRYSHDLRTPLDPVKTYLYLMLSGKAGTFTEKQEKYLKIIDNNINFVANGLHDMYQISKITNQKMRDRISFRDFDIAQTIQSVLESFQSQAQAKDIKLSFTFDKSPQIFNGYQHGIEQMMRNFLQNAIKFSNKGIVAVALADISDTIQIQIKDTGMGIPQEDLKNVFKPFFRTKGRERVTEGSGLGLTISKEIIILHNGKIKVASEENTGTIFFIILPKQRHIKKDDEIIIDKL